MNNLINVKEQYQLPDNRILSIETKKEGYEFFLYTSEGEIWCRGMIESDTNMTENEILKEMLGYLDIPERELYNIKKCKENIILPTKSKITRVVQY